MKPPRHRYPRRPEAPSVRHALHNSVRQFYHGETWRALRDAALARDGHVCQVRLFGCLGVATVADHIKPRPKDVVAFNPAFDHINNLRAVCRNCHARLRVPEHLRVL